MRSTEYTKKELDREARNAVKGKGKLLRWTIRLDTWNSGIQQTAICLRVYYFSKEFEREQITHVAI